MEKKVTFRELLSQGQIFAPCVYDCLSARAADLCGYKALMMSGGAVAYSMDGQPDMGFASLDEIVWVTERITNVSPWPLIVDMDDGYAESPAVIYRNVKRLIKAGCMGLTLDDSTGIRGVERWIGKGKKKWGLVSTEEWLAKIDAALEAAAGTDCVVIARSEQQIRTEEGFKIAVDRGLRAKELGAEMVMLGTRTTADGYRVAKYIKGWKMWPDVGSTNGVPNANLEEIDKLGYNFVTMHLFEKAALYGMMKFGMLNDANGNSVASDLDDMIGHPELAEQMQIIGNYRKWAELEKKARAGV